MIRDRRQRKTLTQDVVEKSLNHEQLSTLLNSEQFGWRLWFIRKPLFPEAMPVLYNVQHDHVGVLEPDGQINSDVRIKFRPNENRFNDRSLILQVSSSAKNNVQTERRRNKSSAVENLDDLLNQHQMRALRYVESSGWKLFCVRTSLFQDPEVVIVNADGDMFATLEHDGEINMAPDLSLRKADWPVGIDKQAIGGSG
jgi:hypothetical protein